MTRRQVFTLLITAVPAAMLLGCGSRPDSWDKAPSVQYAVGMTNAFALIDESVNAADILTIGSDLQLNQSRQKAGLGVVNAKSSPSGDRLFVLSRGQVPRTKPADERPALRVYDGKGSGAVLGTYPLSAALDGLAIDPQGQFVVVYAAGSSNTFVDNPNELVIIDTSKPASATNPVPKTLRSFGGRPQRLTFTESLQLPSGERRLLLVETDQDLSIQDLDHLDRSEITVKLSDTVKVTPAGLAVTQGVADRLDDTRIAVRTTAENSVYLLTLGAKTDDKAANDFGVLVNIVGFKTVPSDFAFVNTDAGLRLAVLQPSSFEATLVDPDTGVETSVDLPASYGRMAVVTRQVANAPELGSDVALLWGGSSSAASGVAFWSLGKSVGQAYRSIETLTDVASAVSEVIDVPAPNDALKILVPNQLASTGGKFHVLDLAARTAAPLQTTANALELTVSSDGQRAWFYEPQGYEVAVVDLQTLHPQNLVFDRPIWKLFDIKRTGAGRAMVALHPGGTLGATVLDALTPDEASATRYVGLLQGGF